MGDITKKHKTYEILDIKEVEDLPLGWKFEINDKSWDFEELAKWGDRKDLAYWFSVIFWRLRSVHKDDTRILYWYSFKKFWEFLEYTELNICKPEEIDSDTLFFFNSWLINQKYLVNYKEKEAGIDSLASSTKRKIFGNIKQTIKRLISINITRSDLCLPNYVYSDSNINSEKTIPFSKSERNRIVHACKEEFELIAAKKITNNRHIYVPYILTLALRTGFNLQPLLDLTVDSIRPSILDGRLEVSIKKNRGYSSQRISVQDDDTDESVFVSKRIGSLICDLIKITDTLRKLAPRNVAASIWLVSTPFDTDIRVMTAYETWVNIQRFRDKYQLKNDSGKPLQLNIRRMRPTFSQALLRINGGDIRDLQKRLNHKNISTTMNYLDANQDEFKSSFHFRGIIMQNVFTSGSPEELALQLQCSLQEAQEMLLGNNKMVVGSCRNPFASPFKQTDDVTPCTRFMACFRCQNQVITQGDLHKIFSFYWFLLHKKSIMPEHAWQHG
ncbi:MAG: site-specific integrase, partial [Methanobacterium sp.]